MSGALVIEQGFAWCTASGTPETLEWLDDTLTVSCEGFVRGRWRRWKRSLYYRRYSRFPAGLFDLVLSRAARGGVHVSVVDGTAEMDIRLVDRQLSEPLYDYQECAVAEALKKRRGILAIATGGGKTRIAVAIMSRVDGKSLFVADEVGLILQAREVYERLTGEVGGLIQGDTCKLSRVTFATLQTLRARWKRLKSYISEVSCVIFDEVHVIAAQEYWKVAMGIPNAVFRIGLTATPVGRGDNMDLRTVGATGPVIYSLGINELTHDYEKLSPVKIVFYAYPGAPDVQARTWQNVYREGIVYNEARNRAIVRICKIAPKPVLVFFERKAHGRILRDLLEIAGFSVSLVCGASSGEARREAVELLDKAEVDVLLASRIFNKGVDIPRVKSCVNAAGLKAQITSIQRLGRGLRRVPGEKEQAVFFDLFDQNDATLTRHAEERKKVYEDELKQIVFVTRELSEAVRWIKASVRQLKLV